MTDDAPPPADLLAHAGFVRRLAFHLLRDDADADDAAQETLARALARPPRAGPGVRAWLATVLRNIVRKEGRGASRRARREAAVARPEGGRAGDDAVAREEILRSVTEAVASLDAAQREVVLLRHYEDLPPRDIAARLGVPVETVKSRLKRAHAALRTRLDERRAGNVEGWRSALAIAIGLPRDGGRSVPFEPVRATPPVLVPAAALVLLIGGGAWFFASRTSPGGSGPPPDAAGGVALADDAVPAPPPPELRAPRAAPPAPAAPPAARSVAVTPPGWKRVRVGGMSFALPPDWISDPRADADTSTWTAGTPPAPGRGTRFAVVASHHVPMLETGIRVPVRSAVSLAGRAATRTEGAGKDDHLVLVRFDAPAAGDEAPGIAFLARADTAAWPAYVDTLPLILGSIAWETTPEGDGGSESALPSPLFLHALETDLAPGVFGGTVLHGSRPVAGAVVTLSRAGVDPWGAPRPGAEIAATGATDAAGRFTFDGLAFGKTWTARVDAGPLGVRSVTLVMQAQGRPRRVTVVYGTGAIEGRVFLRTGLPAAGLKVTASGGYHGAVDAAVRGEVVTAADGSYRLAGLTPGTWVLVTRLVPGVGLPADQRSASVKLALGETRTLDLGTEHPEPEWRGALRLASGTLVRGPGPFVMLHRVPGPDGLSTSPDAEGRIAQRLPAGTYRGTGVRPLFVERTLMFDLVVPPEGVEKDIPVPGVRVSGVVRDAAPSDPGAPAPTVHIARTRGRHAIGVPARPDGTFDAYAVPEGKHVCWALRGDRTSPEVEIDVPADRDLDGIAVVLPAP
jgi:RNA polymerase sigma-70 factor (ECF subfamily)